MYIRFWYTKLMYGEIYRANMSEHQNFQNSLDMVYGCR